ncbi:MSHA fimbrial ATPase MshE, partial [Aeromonas sp. HMWF017]
QDTGFELGSSNLGANDEGEATVAKLLRSLFEDAVQVGASDIHIEPDEKVLRIRQRIDGILHENILNEVRIAQALVLRLKLVAGLDISEKRLPQDGRFNMKVRGRDVDVRMSTMPVQYGESVVMRLLDQSSGILSLTETGMPPEILTRFRRQLKRPHGMILVTGPTGSGKTTTLYGALSELNQSSNKIITVEDPVEYRLSRVNQVQVNPKIGLTFSNVLRSTLRQDPDILLVGEMRDNETVEIGLRGAITGHLVLTTLHTNDAVTSALRLIDMGAPGYLVASALRAVVAQRLVRRVCEHCVEEKAPDEGQATWLTVLSGEAPGQHTYHKGRGCQSCNFTGYSGRIGVYELLELDQPMMDALRRNDAEGFAKAARQHEHYRPLALTALDYARQGITSVDEVLRLAEDLG